jgi:SAM-dependent methyltransferase
MLDGHDLYELCAQSPGAEARFLRAAHGDSPRVLREDFCGPGGVARAWLRLSPRHECIVVDRDPEPLARAMGGGIGAPRGARADPRLTGVCDDVLRVRAKADVIAALNFAACELHERAVLVKYLRAALASLRPRGVLVFDLYGGTEAYTPGTYSRKLRGPAGERIEYTWEQRAADPVTARVVNAMHFKVTDRPGVRPRVLRDAFVYDWRLWTIAELREAMLESGFKSVDVYDRIGDAADSSGNVYVRPLEPGEGLDDNWVAYVAARR